MNADVQVIARMTVRAGRVAYDPSGLSMVEWEKARPQYFNNPSEGNPAPATAEDLPQHLSGKAQQGDSDAGKNGSSQVAARRN